MLILSRRRKESIVINGPCVIEIIEVREGRARLAFHAEPSTSVARVEVLQQPGALSGLRDVHERLTGQWRGQAATSAQPAA